MAMYPGSPPPQWQPPPKSDNTRVYSVLAYIGILWLVGLLADRHNPRVAFHVNQGIILTVTSAVLGIASGILAGILGGILGAIFSFVPGGFFWWGPWSVLSAVFHSLWGIVMLIYMILGIRNAVRGEEKPLPIIGNLFCIVR